MYSMKLPITLYLLCLPFFLVQLAQNNYLEEILYINLRRIEME